MLSAKALAYCPRTQKFEKRLARYLSWRWRIGAKEWQYFRPYRIETLVRGIRLPIHERFPGRTRDRLERAFDQLEKDQIIAGFHYKGWMEPSGYRWLDKWLDTNVQIEPPEIIIDEYRRIGTPKSEAPTDLGVRLRAKRAAEHLNRLRAAEQIGISPEQLLYAEIDVPPGIVRAKLERWLANSIAS